MSFYLKKNILIYLSISLLTVQSCTPQTDHYTDKAFDKPKLYSYNREVEGQNIQINSFYITMRDGVQIAADVYLPKKLKNVEQLPTILFQTRYWRSIGFKWPASMFYNQLDFNGAGKEYIKTFIANGYAFVSIDVRGSGASTGVWKHPFSSDEIKDGSEIADWIIKQPWSNGIIGTFGRSYSGSAAEFALVNNHPAIKAAMPMYAPFDVFDDIGFPGGMHNQWYTSTWGKLNQLLDQNIVPVDDWKADFFVSGVSPVKNHYEILKTAIVEHQENVSIDKEALKVSFRDDHINAKIENIDVFSPYSFINEINHAKTPIYSYSGWMDGGYQHAAIRRFLNLESPDKKLIIGPWGHMGTYNISPANPGRSGFDHLSEILKFFDFHLKNIENGIRKEAPIHYFTMVEEKWKESYQWPPNHVSNKTYFFHGKSHLTDSSSELAITNLDVHPSTAAGLNTRWEALAGDHPKPPFYPNRTTKDSTLLHYSTLPLKMDAEVTGHPILSVFVSIPNKDLGLIVYLEDVNQTGEVKHVTVGHFRGIHRKTQEESSLYKDVVIGHSYKQEDASPLTPGEVTKLTFDLLPTSYLFKKGHSIRITIVSNDIDHFTNLNTDLKTIKIYSGGQYSSSIQLPISWHDLEE